MEILIEHVFLTYRGDVPALYDINLRLKPGICGLLGPAGAGKSSLLRILATIEAPSWGAVRVGPYTLPGEQHRVRKLIGYLPRPCRLFENMTAAEFVDYMALLKGFGGKRDRAAEVARLLALVGSENTRQLIRSYSGGMKQRLALAQALIGSPPALLLDEPLTGLEPAERVRLGGVLHALGKKDERLVLLAGDSAGEVSAVCDRLVVLNRGRLLFEGTPPELAAKAADKVWEVISGDEDFAPQPEETVIFARREAEHRIVRLLAPAKPARGAVPAIPTAEDGYIAVVSGDEAMDV